MKVAIIGMGNMGSKYARMILEGRIQNMALVASTRIRVERREELKDVWQENIKVYDSADSLYEAYDNNEIIFDAVIIVTPHYSHEKQAIDAFRRGISVLCDKPAGVYSRQARNMQLEYEKAKALHKELIYGYIFHQRTFPIYSKMKEIVESKQYGKVKRVNWIITDWYRSNAYYTSSPWRATWEHDGGGTLLNQCPHNLDLLWWICSMPESVQGFCHNGKFHPIEVEDDVTAYMEWENGATGVFVASTGDAAGVNRLEISMDDAMLVCERGSLRICTLDKPESEYRNGTGDMFAKPVCNWENIECAPVEGAYEKLLNDFAIGKLVAAGNEAINSLYLSNAIYLSSWKQKKILIPKGDLAYELKFEEDFEKELKARY